MVTTPTGPTAIPKIVRGSDGQLKTIYIDAKTGVTLQSLTGYKIASAGNGSVDLSQIPTLAKKEDDGKNPYEDTDEPVDARTALDIIHNSEGGKRDQSFGKPGYSQSAIGNYGYAHKGAIGTALSAVGGLAGKAIGLGWNMNNERAVQTARDVVGLPQKSIKDTIGGILRDNAGQVTTGAKINNKTYNVGFEAMSPAGKTNLTPSEARQRALTLGGVSETKEGPKNSNKSAVSKVAGKIGSKIEAATGIKPGFAKRALDRVFGVDESKEDKAKKPGGLLTEITGIQPGFATRALDRVVYGTALPSTAPTPTAKPTQALSSLSEAAANTPTNTPASSDSVGFQAAFGPNRPNMPSSKITDAVKSAVGATFGPGYSVKGISGTEGPDKEQYGSPRHKTGLALDFDVTDPMGNKVTDAAKLNDLASNFALANPEAGVGFGVGYMTDENNQPGRMHLDVTGMGKAWGAANTRKNMDPALAQTIDAARLGFAPTPFSNPPTPTARPSEVEHNFVSQDERPSQINDPVGDSLDPTRATSLFSPPSEQQSIARQTISESLNTPAVDTASLANATPAQFANMGLVTRTPAERQKIAMTLAGELAPSTLRGLMDDDPTAKSELANMMSTMENRATSKMFSSIDDALDPSQYSSLAASNLSVTKANYAKFSEVLGKAVDSFYTGQITPTDFGLTSYFNPGLVDPSWGQVMSSVTQVGKHLFGSLPEYGPSASFKDQRSALTAPANNYAGAGTSIGYSSLDTPSERNGIGIGMNFHDSSIGTGSAFGGTPGQSGGAGYTPGGMNSPSGSSYGGSMGGGSSFGGVRSGGIGSDHGASASSAGGGFGSGGIGSDHGASNSSSSGGSKGSSSKGGGGIGSDHGASSRGGNNNDHGGGGIGHA